MVKKMALSLEPPTVITGIGPGLKAGFLILLQPRHGILGPAVNIP